MNEQQPITLTPDRPARAAQFYARLYRYKILLQRRWWVLLTVMIGNMPAARMGDNTAHGGVIVGCCPMVLIGG